MKASDIPKSECLADVIARVVPFFETDVLPALRAGKRVLICAHGNSIRAICKYSTSCSYSSVDPDSSKTKSRRVYLTRAVCVKQSCLKQWNPVVCVAPCVPDPDCPGRVHRPVTTRRTVHVVSSLAISSFCTARGRRGRGASVARGLTCPGSARRSGSAQASMRNSLTEKKVCRLQYQRHTGT